MALILCIGPYRGQVEGLHIPQAPEQPGVEHLNQRAGDPAGGKGAQAPLFGHDGRQRPRYGKRGCPGPGLK